MLVNTINKDIANKFSEMGFRLLKHAFDINGVELWTFSVNKSRVDINDEEFAGKCFSTDDRLTLTF